MSVAAIAWTQTAVAQETAAPDTESIEHGPIMANLKIGPAIGVADFSGDTAFALELEGGYAILGKEGYVTFSPNFSFGTLTLVTLPVGFQYGIQLPVKNLTAYGRATIGVTFATQGGDPAFHFGPHIGAKYQINEMFHAGLEPVSLPIYVGNGGVGLQYRILAYAGADF
jgi:hypothetical protein